MANIKTPKLQLEGCLRVFDLGARLFVDEPIDLAGCPRPHS